MKIAIIGAGFCGCTLYNLLKQNGHTITVFEKSRGVGGRCSTKYIEKELINHGTQSFKVSSSIFQKFLEQFVKNKILLRNNDLYYANNGINKICSSLIDDTDLKKTTKIVSYKYLKGYWFLCDENGLEYKGFDKIFFTIPAPQVIESSIELSQEIYQKINTIKYDSLATLIIYSKKLINIFKEELQNNKYIYKVINNSLKNNCVIHFNKQFIQKYKITKKDEIEQHGVEFLSNLLKVDFHKDTQFLPHYWKYAFVSQTINDSYLYDSKLSVGFCGDYFKNGNMESSYFSAKILFQKLSKINTI